MNKTIKRGLSLLLAIMLIASTFAVFSSAASYQSVFAQNLIEYASVGETVPIVFLYIPAYKNEKVETYIYDKNGNAVASASKQIYNSYSTMFTYTITWDTTGLEAGEYKLEMYKYFYTYSSWHEAPSTTVAYIRLTDDMNNGGYGKNNYTGTETHFTCEMEGTQTIAAGSVCTAQSAWKKTELPSKNCSIQLKELYKGEEAETIVLDENMYNPHPAGCEWLLMKFEITNNGTEELEPYSIFADYNFTKSTGNIMTVCDSATLSDDMVDIIDIDSIAAGETAEGWIGVLIPDYQGMPYLKVEAGTAFGYLNINPDSVNGTVQKHIYKSAVTAATTSKDGCVTKKCTVCGAIGSKTTIKKIKSVTLSKSSFTYNGKVQKPSVTVKDSGGNVISSKYYTVTYSSGCKNPGQYTVTVKFKGNYSGSKKLTYKILPAKVTGVTFKSTAAKKGTVTFTKVAGVTGYQIYYSTSKNGTYKRLTNTTKNSYTYSKFASKKGYYIKVRAYKKVSSDSYIYGAFSSVVGAKIK